MLRFSKRELSDKVLYLTKTVFLAPVVVLATCGKPELLHHSLRRPDRLDTEVEISVPTANDR